MAQTCRTCRGTGTVVDNPCAECHGSGSVRKSEKVSVTIPAGQKVAYYTLDESVYKWMVGGWTPAVANPVPAGNSLVGVACMSVGNGRSLILELNKSHGAATVVYVTLVGFHAKMVRDER